VESVSRIDIRCASLSDSAAVLKCLAEAFAPYRSAYTPAAFDDTVPDEQGIRVRIEQMRVLVASSAGDVVGTISATSTSGHGHLRGFAVLPAWHGKGVAAKLLRAMEDWLVSCGSTQVSLETTMPLAAAIRFYEKNGYQRSGNISDYFGMPLIEYVKQL